MTIPELLPILLILFVFIYVYIYSCLTKTSFMKFPKSTYNWVSLSGVVIAIFSLFMIVFLFIVSTLFGDGSSYLGLFIFIVLPAFLVLGLLIIPVGMLIKMRRDKKLERTGEPGRWPEINLNLSHHRNAALVFLGGSVIFLLLTALGSYEAFHYTESVEFCGEVCHQVMEPEFVAYQNSSHARVACVDCHVGPGADWYVKSKLSGLYQVYAVATGNYPKPIPTPIKSLRPAQETCEQCHWPQKFYARKHRIERHYLPDENNSEWDIVLQMKTGPQHSAQGLSEGIHWHINPDVKIEYLATSDRETIPWVRYTNKKTGAVYEYQDPASPMTDAGRDTLELRTMDCMDCHNRPSHEYNSPMTFINNAMTSGRIPEELPDIKMMAMQLLYMDYPTKDSAFRFIEDQINEYYNVFYEDQMDEYGDMVSSSIEVIKEEYAKNIFPGMKVNWETYPNHIGHLETEGCFRCHNDKYKSPEGHVISMDCNQCHHITAQGFTDSMQVANVYESLEFIHPNDPDAAWKDYMCSDCHKDVYK